MLLVWTNSAFSRQSKPKSRRPSSSSAGMTKSKIFNCLSSDFLRSLWARISAKSTSAMAPTESPSDNTCIVVLGASGDLAFKKTYPALFGLYKFGFLPPSCQIVGYARSEIELDDFKKRISSKMNAKDDSALLTSFLKMCYYVSGKYDQAASFERLNSFVLSLESKCSKAAKMNRIFYMALYVSAPNLTVDRPPSVFIPASAGIYDHVHSKSGHNRIVVEKPFGKDFDSSKDLSKALASRWGEDEVRIY